MQRTRYVSRFAMWVSMVALAGALFPLIFTPDPLWAQADAQQAYQQAKAAFEAGEFAKARDLARQAAQTDLHNPEVFLLLGKAHYQLGELDEALRAWQRTLKLAPEEPFARRMLDALQAQRREVELRISLVDLLIDAGLLPAALDECKKLLSDEALLPKQRADIKLRQAEVLLRSGQPDAALRVAGELETLYENQADALQVAVLRSRAELRSKGEAAVRGLARLKQLLAEKPDGPHAATAQAEVLIFQLQQDATPAGADALAKWLDQQPEHFLAPEARKALLDACYTLALRSAPPAPDAPLGPWEAKIKARLEQLAAQPGRAAELAGLFAQFVKHVEARYVQRGAYQAAVEAAELKPGVPWPAEVRRAALKVLAKSKTALALRSLKRRATAGKLPVSAPLGKLPAELAEPIAIYQTIQRDFPDQPGWGELVGLADQVQQLAAQTPVVGKPKVLKAPDAWAVTILSQVVKADEDAAAVGKAVELVQAIARRYAGLKTVEGHQLAVQLSRALIEAPLSPDHPAWPGAMAHHIELLDQYARAVFAENIESGNAAANAVLSEPQQRLLARAKQLLARNGSAAERLLALAKAHVQPWVEHQQWKVAGEFVEGLTGALPETHRFQGELFLVNLWTQQVFQEHERLLSAGLDVPRQLDSRLRRALKRLCELQAGLDPESDELGQVASARGVGCDRGPLCPTGI